MLLSLSAFVRFFIKETACLCCVDLTDESAKPSTVVTAAVTEPTPHQHKLQAVGIQERKQTIYKLSFTTF